MAEETERLKRFAEFWRKNNQRNPDAFPMKMADGNEGAWTEMLAAFDDVAVTDAMALLPKTENN